MDDSVERFDALFRRACKTWLGRPFVDMLEQQTDFIQILREVIRRSRPALSPQSDLTLRMFFRGPTITKSNMLDCLELCIEACENYEKAERSIDGLLL